MFKSLILTIKKTKRCLSKGVGIMAAQVLCVNQALAEGGGSGLGPIFDKLKGYFTEFQTFLSGPFGKMVMVASIVVAFAAWNFLPREGLFASVARGIITGVAIANAVTFASTLFASA